MEDFFKQKVQIKSDNIPLCGKDDVVSDAVILANAGIHGFPIKVGNDRNVRHPNITDASRADRGCPDFADLIGIGQTDLDVV